jgi:hypothetical protein
MHGLSEEEEAGKKKFKIQKYVNNGDINAASDK